MAYYYKINESEKSLPLYKSFHLQKAKKVQLEGPKINYDFSKHVLIELLDDTTPEAKLWKELGLTKNKNILHKRMMVDSHRVRCRRAIVVCVNPEEAQKLAERLSQAQVMKRCICATVVKDLLADICLFEKQIIQHGDNKSQQQLLYVCDLNKCRGTSGLVRFLKDKFSKFGTILSVLVCADENGYAFPEGVIKFAYLSEAFAAELAFDQFVIGKERISVTTHHNILLSQCDLKARLRNAQWMHNYTSWSKSPLSLDDETSVKAFSIYNDFVNSVENLHVSSEENKENKNENLTLLENASTCSDVSDTKIIKHNKCKTASNIENDKTISAFACKENITSNNVKNHKNKKSLKNHAKNVLMSNLHALSIQKNTSPESYKNRTMHLKTSDVSNPTYFKAESPEKCFQSESDSSSYVTCSNGNKSPNNHCSQISADKTIFNSVDSSFWGNSCSNIFSPSHFISKELSPNSDNKLDGSASTVIMSTNSCKRKKKFAPSQKLCLKSQRIGLSQDDRISSKKTLTNESFVDKTLTENPNCSSITVNNLNSLFHNNIHGKSKVSNWLLNLSYNEKNVVTKTEKTESEITLTNKESNYKIPGKMFSDKNSTQSYSKMDLSNHCSQPSSDKNDHLSEENIVYENVTIPNLQNIIVGDSKTPIQAWLKEELKISINNRVTSSEEASKSVIVCATRTKDVAVSVGCSHMTCESCYPDSSNLLLGYS